ncbi:probable cyclin-dependent serine/threonine-protein kinase DDB_G0292550 isoform X31 [Daktulosphaira vitifoliae]|uniref:probable cyclin-dependent serine/threonine-protein kinase DDB_G0292550 isoform X31 n=1 Tax=Daktulosphaira vitifoliae TaxID=58002 RepID=UPI0021A9C2B8|nr:probable cyclin-dependent serine/threonine-protein kinase DDB_G0292550 isoform X31 [Daktulosphaira vitifoliae]
MIYFTFLWIIVTLVIQTQEFNPKHVHHSNEKKLIAYKDEEKKECQIRFNNYGKEEQFVALNLKYNFGNKKTLSRKEIINIIDEDMIKFCENYKITFVDLNDKKKFRSKRASDKKRYQGQTQTQFVSFGPQYSNNQSVKNGIAEAVSQPDMSKATVSGVNFMGQAQSQSSVTDCDDCKEQNIEKNHNSIKHYTSPHSLTDFNGRKYKENILNFPPNVPSNNNKPIQLTQENQNNFKKHLMTNNENRLPSYYLNAGKNIQEVSLPKPVENNADFSYGNIPNDNAAPNNNDFSTYKNNLNPTYNKQPFDYFNENRLQLLNNYSNEHSSPNQMNINQKPLINYEQSNSKDKTLNPNSPYNFKQQLVSNNNPLNLPQSRYFLNTNPPYTNPTQSHSKVITNQQNQKTLSDDINYAQKPFFYSAYSNIRHPLLNQNLNQFNLPTLCSYIYQTCLNAISNIRDQAGLSYHQFPLNYQGTKQHDNSMLTQNFYPESGQILTENNGFRRQKFMYIQPNYADSIQNLIGYNPSNEYIRQHPIQPSYLGLVQVPIRNNEPSNQQPINTQLSYSGLDQSPINNNGLFGQQPTNTQSSFSDLGQSSVSDNVPHNQQLTSTQFSYPGTGQTPINNNNGLFGQQSTNTQSSFSDLGQSSVSDNVPHNQQLTSTQFSYPGTGQTPINNNNGLFGQQSTNTQSSFSDLGQSSVSDNVPHNQQLTSTQFSYPGTGQTPINNNNGLFGQQSTNTQSSFSDLGQSSVSDNVPHNQQLTSTQFSYPGTGQTPINNNNGLFGQQSTNTQSSYPGYSQSPINNNGLFGQQSTNTTQPNYPGTGQTPINNNNGLFGQQSTNTTQPNYPGTGQTPINNNNGLFGQQSTNTTQPNYPGTGQTPINNNNGLFGQQPTNAQSSYPGYSQSPINNNGLFGQQPTNTQSSFSDLGQSSVGDNVPHNQQPTSTQFSYPGTGQTPINNNNGLFGQQSTNTTQPNYPGTGQTPINNNNGLFGQQPTNAQSSYLGYSQSPINNNGLFGQQPTNTQSSFSDLGQSSVGDNVPHNQQPTSSQFSYPGASQTSINNNNPFDEHPTNTQSSYSKLGQSSIGNNAPSISQLAYASPNYSRSDQSFNDKNTSTGPQFQVSSPIPINIQQLDSELPNKLTHTTNYAITGGKIGSDVSIGNLMTPIDTEGGDSQSLTSLNIDGKETSALASAQGKSTSGITQTQVSGSYSGTGIFSAQAQTSDSDKGAQSVIMGNSNGTTSSAEGKGGKSKVQSQMHYNYETGTALGEAQSSGINYTTNTQLEVGVKGGIADAQSSGPGSTSSQAQIGFLPHDLNNNTDQKSLFKGGGTALAQGGTYTGQSQSQLFGSYKHGISYNGAAQASSGKNYQNLPKLTIGNSKNTINKLEKIGNNSRDDIQLHKSFQMLEENQTSTQKIKILDNVMNTTQNSIIYSTSTSSPIYSSSESSQNFDVDSEYNYDNEYYEDEKEDQIYSKTELNAKENIPTQAQNSFLNLGDKHDIKIIRDTDKTMKNSQVLSSGEIIPGTNGTKVPIGLRARVTSVAGDQTEAKAFPGGQAQSQTIHYTPGSGGLTIVDKTKLRALLGNESYITPLNKTYKHFQTDTNGETGFYQSSDKNIQYYTKSSTCGYFSFSCNYIDGAKTGAKICKPNALPFPCQNKILVR